MPYGVGAGIQGALGIAKLRQQKQMADRAAMGQMGAGVGAIGEGIQQIIAQKKAEADEQDVLNVLSGGAPTTAKGAIIAQKRDQMMFERDLGERKMNRQRRRDTFAETDRARDIQWSTEDRARAEDDRQRGIETAKTEAARKAQEEKEIAGLMAYEQFPSATFTLGDQEHTVGFDRPNITKKGSAEFAHKRSEAKRRSEPKALDPLRAEEIRSRMEKRKSDMATAKAKLESMGMPTTTALLSAAVDSLESKKSPQGQWQELETTPFGWKEIVDWIMKFKTEMGGGEGGGSYRDWAREEGWEGD